MASLARRFKFSANGTLGTLCGGLFCTLLCMAIQNSSLPLSLLASEDIRFAKESSGHWIASLARLAPGSYFISVGKPRSLCDLVVDGNTIATTRSSDPALRENLLLGASISVTAEAPKEKAEVICVNESGFGPGLTHEPAVVKYRVGALLQLWRGITDLLLGAFCSVTLLWSMIFRRRKGALREDRYAFWFFALSSLAYSLSLAHFPRLFLPGLEATVAHAALRALFGWSFFLLCTQKKASRLIAAVSYLGLLALYLAVARFLPDSLEPLYDATVPFFSIITAVAVIDAFKVSVASRSALLMRYIAITWLFAQIADVSSVAFNKGPYLAPSVVALMTLSIALLRRFEEERTRAIASVTSEALRIINSPLAIEAKLREIGLLLRLKTSFQRVSVYADAYILGSHDRPHERFLRVMEYGYLKDTVQDRIIDLREDQGIWMKKALDGGHPSLIKSCFDKAWFSNIPLGAHAVLNLSDSIDRPAFLATESHDLVQSALPALQSISEQLVEYGARIGFALEVLRLIRGDGTWSEEVGCIFIDANGYDDSLQRYGEPYGQFLTKIYLPALCQRVRKWCVREGSPSGDGVYLVIISDLMQERCPPAEAVYRAIEEILRFTQNEGAEICAAQGYEPVRLQIGANAGMATVICDAFQVRTNGATVNIAARLQAAGQPGQILVHAELARLWPKDGNLSIDAPVPELKKTRRLTACRVFLRKKAA